MQSRPAPPPARAAALLLGAVTLGAALLGGCGGSGDDGSPAPSPTAPALTARLEPASGSDLARRVDLVLTGDVTVTSVRLRGGGFVQVDAQPAGGSATVGTPVRLPLAYGPVLCAGRAAPVAVELGTPDGEQVVPVLDDQVLPALRAAECAAAP